MHYLCDMFHRAQQGAQSRIAQRLMPYSNGTIKASGGLYIGSTGMVMGDWRISYKMDHRCSYGDMPDPP